MNVVMRSIDRARGLLKQLFRTENADLDFGIYRIMNYKRTEIERFIDQDLIEAAEAEFKEFARAGAAELEKELERRKREINDFVPGTIGEDLEILKNHDLPKVKEFMGVLEEYRTASVSEEQVQDVFNHVYEFFSRYYEDGDFIPRTRYGGRDKYLVPYNGEEVLLHWATKNMYYVKTGEYFNKYCFRARRFRVIFKLVEAQIEQGNVKGDKKFFILHDEDPVHFEEASDEVEIRFNYRTLTDEENERYGRRTRAKIQEDLIDEALTKIGASLGVSSISGILRPRGDEEKSLMRKHLEAYVGRNTKDFFIHKDLKGFLSKELDFYLKNEVLDLNLLESTSVSQTKLMMAKVKAIRGISIKIIEFLTQIEEFQKRLFEKKKLVLRTEYCITLDLIPEEFYDEIGKNHDQILEWKELYGLDEISVGTFYNTKGSHIFNKELLKQYKYLVLDTKYFTNDFKCRLLDYIDDIDKKVNGLLINSENFHALKLLCEKYKNNIKCTYIDPPYNTRNNDFLYKDNYRNASWMSMMYDRLYLSKQFLLNDGAIFVSIDDNEADNLKKIMIEIFGKENYLSQIVWQHSIQGKNDVKGFSLHHNYIIAFRQSEIFIPKKLERTEEHNVAYSNPDNDPKGLWRSGDVRSPNYRENLRYDIITPSGNVIPPPPNGWRWNKEKVEEKIRIGEIIFKEEETKIIRKIYLVDVGGRVPESIWFGKEVGTTRVANSELKALFNKSRIFDTPKPTKLLERILELSNPNDSFVFDFFAGSGSLAHAVINKHEEFNAKYILVEMGDFFDFITIPRIKKIIFSRDWKNGIPQNTNGISHILKYQYLEQYEDTLNNIEFIQSDSSIQSRLDRLPDYFLTYMLDYETKDSPTRIYFKQFKTPFNYRIKTISGGEEIEEPVDLVETFNYLLGLHVNCLRTFKDGDRLYRMVYGTRGNEQVVVIWRDTPDLDLKRDKGFIENTVLLNISPDTVYINGDSYLKNAYPIEPEFKKLMGA